MKLRVQYLAQLRTTVGQAEEVVELPDGTTLAGLFRNLALRHGEKAAAHLLTPQGKVQPSLMVVVNGGATSSRDLESLVLGPLDVVMLMPPIAGG